MTIRQGLTFDDVLLMPMQGVLGKRKDADISSELVPGVKLDVPIVSANMPSVTESNMAEAMFAAGGMGFLHRFNTPEENKLEYQKVTRWLDTSDWNHNNADCVVSFGLDDMLRVSMLYNAGARIFCLDVAHGDHEKVIETVNRIRSLYEKEIYLIVGNIATVGGAYRMAEAGVDAVKVGIGPGAACRTREVTGFGVPQLTAIMDVHSMVEGKVKIIADGGIKNSGDIVKALAAGADTVMIGSLLAGCNEAPNPGVYYGNASVYMNGHRAPEGVEGLVLKTGPVEDVIKELAWGIRSGISYGGATNIKELRAEARFIQVTAAGQVENSTRVQEYEYNYELQHLMPT
jgi:IMP dehydrogenase